MGNIFLGRRVASGRGIFYTNSSRPGLSVLSGKNEWLAASFNTVNDGAAVRVTGDRAALKNVPIKIHLEAASWLGYFRVVGELRK